MTLVIRLKREVKNKIEKVYIHISRHSCGLMRIKLIDFCYEMVSIISCLCSFPMVDLCF